MRRPGLVPAGAVEIVQFNCGSGIFISGHKDHADAYSCAAFSTICTAMSIRSSTLYRTIVNNDFSLCFGGAHDAAFLNSDAWLAQGFNTIKR